MFKWNILSFFASDKDYKMECEIKEYILYTWKKGEAGRWLIQNGIDIKIIRIGKE